MVLQSKKEELLAAWRALGGSSDTDGWRTIPISLGGNYGLLAGRHFPGNEEALLVGFRSVRVPPPGQLPTGRGFQVAKADLEGGGGRIWISLSRQKAGSLELFSMMADDVLGILSNSRSLDEEKLFHTFLSRIGAWQDFMQRSNDGVLGAESEVGLFGELVVLQALIDAGLPAEVAVEAWNGPLKGIQDFALGTGAIEVKTTVSPSGFPACIGSLEQLDDSLIFPLFLTGVRLLVDQSGMTLPQFIGELRGELQAYSAASGSLERRLLHAGYFDDVAERYTRRFATIGMRTIAVTSSFPRLTRANVDVEIRKVRYELDLDLVRQEEIELDCALTQLGVI